jgi:hypothetical protein
LHRYAACRADIPPGTIIARFSRKRHGLERRQEARRGAGGTLKVTGVTPRVLNRSAE